MYRHHAWILIAFYAIFAGASVTALFSWGFIPCAVTMAALLLAASALLKHYKCHACGLMVFRNWDHLGHPFRKNCVRCGADLRDVRFRSYMANRPAKE